jgi:hypothetical protein
MADFRSVLDLAPDRSRPEIQIVMVGSFRRRLRFLPSPAPILIVLGIMLGQAFMMWTHERQAAGETPLLVLTVIVSPQERAAVHGMFSVGALEAMPNFSVPPSRSCRLFSARYRHCHDAVQLAVLFTARS